MVVVQDIWLIFISNIGGGSLFLVNQLTAPLTDIILALLGSKKINMFFFFYRWNGDSIMDEVFLFKYIDSGLKIRKYSRK